MMEYNDRLGLEKQCQSLVIVTNGKKMQHRNDMNQKIESVRMNECYEKSKGDINNAKSLTHYGIFSVFGHIGCLFGYMIYLKYY